jgi:arginyl-tRNA synthetase
MIKEALAKNLVYQKDDGSIWIDLSVEEMDDKLLLRADGTAVYMTQDLGTAKMRYEEWDADTLAYVVGNEQIHHFNVLKLVLKKLSFSWHDCIQHIAYGMVELPDGKMKSREGTVVDADDIMEEMIATAKEKTAALGKIEGFEKEEAETLYYQLMIDISQFNDRVHESANSYNPALVANYTYELVKNYNAYYQEVPVLKEKEKSIVDYRLALSLLVKRSIARAMQLLGIEVPERM